MHFLGWHRTDKQLWLMFRPRTALFSHQSFYFHKITKNRRYLSCIIRLAFISLTKMYSLLALYLYVVAFNYRTFRQVADKISIKSMLEKFQLLSVNQLAAEIKLIEVWKSINAEGSPINLAPYNPNLVQSDRSLRPQPSRIFDDRARLALSQSSFHIDAAKVWNGAPAAVHNAASLSGAKKAIKTYCKSLPI